MWRYVRHFPIRTVEASVVQSEALIFRSYNIFAVYSFKPANGEMTSSHQLPRLRRGCAGRLYLRVQVHIPERLSERQRYLFEEVRTAGGRKNLGKPRETAKIQQRHLFEHVRAAASDGGALASCHNVINEIPDPNPRLLPL